LPDGSRFDARAVPEDDKVIKEVGALSDDAASAVPDGLNYHLLNHLLRYFARAGLEQFERARIIFRSDPAEGRIKPFQLVGGLSNVT
jgi:hypothetical protein